MHAYIHLYNFQREHINFLLITSCQFNIEMITIELDKKVNELNTF